jgi:hypothetical protein
LLALATAVHAVDARLSAIRAAQSVLPDSLVHYNMLFAWWRHGDSPRGFTLTPSPYFIDMAVEFPLMLLTPDYERWSYALACSYAVLIFAGLYVVARFVLGATAIFAAAVAGLTLVAFYKLAPFYFVVHAFVVNHTSEIFTTLGMIALAWVWFRPKARRGRYAACALVPAVAVCVMSSPFFIATYCIPAVVAAAAIVGTEYMPARRFVWFAGVTAIGALLGLFALAIVSRYWWPVRGDNYGSSWKAYKAFKHALVTEPGGTRAAWAIAIAALASIALAIVGRRTGRWSIPTVFLCAFFPACTACCVLLPIKRGAFGGPYEFRYITFPSLWACAFYITVGARLAIALATRWQRRLSLRAAPSWLPWTSGALGTAALAIATTCQGPSTIDDTSIDAKMVRCFRDAEQRAGLQDGLGLWWLARYMNAARYATDWHSPYVVVQLLPNDLPQIDPRDNNLAWFDGTYRHGAAKLNFLVTYAMTDRALAFFRDHIGAPDRMITCPLPIFYGTGRPDFDLWVWDRDDAQRRLAELVTHDNLRSPFAPVIGADQMTIDVEWGMRKEHGAVEVNPMWLPSGRYRLELELEPSADAVAEIRVRQDVRGEIARASIAPGDAHPAMTFEIENRGGPTSGAAVYIEVSASAAHSVEVSGATLTMTDESGISPFSVFR